MVIEKEGNMFAYIHEAYAHCVSDNGKMDKGIAAELKRMYPLMFAQYQKLCLEKALSPGQCFHYDWENGQSVFNLIIQAEGGTVSIEHLRASIEEMYFIALDKNIVDIALSQSGQEYGDIPHDTWADCLHTFISDASHHVTLYKI